MIDKEKSEKKSKRLIILIAAIIFLVIATFAATVYFAISSLLSFMQANKAISDDLINQSKQTINQASILITRSAEEMEKGLYLISKGQDIQKLLDKDNSEAIENTLKVFEGYKDTYPEVQTIFLGTKDKKMYIYPQVQLPEDYDPTSRPWYKNALNNKEFTWSEPYMDLGTGMAIITLSLPVYNEDEVIGVLSVDLKLDLMVEAVKNIKLGSNGYIIITDQNGIMVMHPNKEQIGQQVPVQGLGDLTAKGDMGILKYTYQDQEETVIYRRLDKLKLNLIGLIKED